MRILLFVLLNFICFTAVKAQDMVLIKSGSYIPLYGSIDQKPVEVSAFYLDKYPVTNQQFVAFLKENPEYQKS